VGAGAGWLIFSHWKRANFTAIAAAAFLPIDPIPYDLGAAV
jgi:hypothetical protein